MDDGAKKAGGVLAVALTAIGLFVARGADDCARIGARSASYGDDIARVGRYGDDLAGAGRYGDDLAGAGRYGHEVPAVRYGDDVAAHAGDEARLRGGGSPGNRTGGSFGGAHFADEALGDARHLGDEAFVGDDAIETIADAVIDVAPDAAEFLFGGDDPPATWPVRRASEEPGLGTRVLLLGAMPTVLPEDAHRFMAIDMAVDAAPSSLAELEAELRDEASASSVDILVARADARGVRGGPRDPRRSPEALLLRAAQLSHRVVLVTCPDEACVLRAVRAAHQAAEGGAVGLPARLARMRDQHAPSATLYRLQSGDRVRLATSRAPR